MKKGLLLFTGVIELLFFILVFIVSAYSLAYEFLYDVIDGLIGYDMAILINDIFYTMYRPLVDLIPVELEAGLIKLILCGLMIVVSIMLLSFASKKIAYAKLPDAEIYAKKKPLSVFAFFEFLVFAGAAGTIAVTIMDASFEFEMLIIIPQAANAFIMLLVLLFTLISIGKIKKAYKRNILGSTRPIMNQTNGGGASFTQPAFNMTETGPTLYDPLQNQTPQQAYQPNMINKGVDEGDLYAGYPDKVKADLERLDRLYANGALTQDSFQAMRTKILQTLENTGVDSNVNTGVDPNGNPPQV